MVSIGHFTIYKEFMIPIILNIAHNFNHPYFLPIKVSLNSSNTTPNKIPRITCTKGPNKVLEPPTSFMNPSTPSIVNKL